MPEGPEIRIAADRIAKVLEGNVVEDMYFAFSHLAPFSDMLRGQRVLSVKPRGKALLIQFEGGRFVYSHNQLYGRWYLRRRDSLPDTNRQLRMAIHTKRHSALLYSASEIDVLDSQALENHPFLSKLGPDLLDPEVTALAVMERLNSNRFRRRRLAALLLDQQCLCGPGNYLRSEILFVAGLHPLHRPMDLDEDQRRILAETAILLTRRSYQTRGLTVDDHLIVKLKESGWTRNQYCFYVFDRVDEDCHHCGGIIIRESYGSRRLYLCETCQPPPSI